MIDEGDVRSYARIARWLALVVLAFGCGWIGHCTYAAPTTEVSR